MKSLTLSRIGFGLGLLLAPVTALADYSILNNTVNMVGGAMPNLAEYSGTLCDAVEGACGIAAVAGFLIMRFRPLLTIIGVLAMTIAGLRMMIAQDDDVLNKSRAVMSACIAGIVLAYLIDPFLAAFYGQSGSVQRGGMAQGAAIFSTEVTGVIEWALTIAASLSVLMIIISAVRALKYSFVTTEEGVSHMRKTVISVVCGIVLLVIRFALADSLANDVNNPHSIISVGVAIAVFIMSFFCLAATCMVIYAGVQLVISWGNEEAYTKAKTILTRSLFGMIVFFSSLAIIRFVVEPGLS